MNPGMCYWMWSRKGNFIIFMQTQRKVKTKLHWASPIPVKPKLASLHSLRVKVLSQGADSSCWRGRRRCHCSVSSQPALGQVKGRAKEQKSSSNEWHQSEKNQNICSACPCFSPFHLEGRNVLLAVPAEINLPYLLDICIFWFWGMRAAGTHQSLLWKVPFPGSHHSMELSQLGKTAPTQSCTTWDTTAFCKDSTGRKSRGAEKTNHYLVSSDSHQSRQN